MVILSHETKETLGDVRVRVPMPASFKCPITCEVMVDPVQTSDGHVYDRKSIAEWFARGHHISPMTGLRLQNFRLIPLEPLRRAIEDYMQEVSPHFAYHEVDTASLQKSLEKSKVEQHSETEASILNDKQRRAWKKMLFTAARKDDAYVIRGLYEAESCGAIGIIASQSFPLALVAIKSGSRDVLEALVEIGVSLDTKDVDGSTLMHYAVRQDDASIIEVLSRLGAPLDTMNDFGSPLCLAAYYGNIQAVHVLQKCGVQADESRDVLGYNALQVCVRREGNTEVIKALCSFGVPAYADEALFMSAIRIAIIFGHLENLETLLVHMESNDILLPRSVPFWSFDAVWSSNGSAVLQVLNRFHVPLDTVDSKFEYLAMNELHLLRDIIKIGVDNIFWFTPGDFAILSFHQSILKTVEQLSEAWKAIGTYGCEGQTAMHWAAICGNCSAIQTLSSFKISLTTEDTAGCTPAHFAALMGHVEVLELLNSIDVELSIVSYSGFTPADYARQIGHTAAASFLQIFDE